MTNEEKRKIYAALAAPFPEHCIQRTEGRITGRGYDTSGIGYQYIANRLNEVLGVGGWRAHRVITVKEVTRSNGRPAFEAIADITLELGSWVDGNFIVFAESLADGGHVASAESDARKGAYTNAFKKAAAFFGVGRQAYEGSLDDDNVPSDSPVHPEHQPIPTAPTRTVTTVPVTPAPPRNRLSSKQLGAIQAIGRKLGLDHTGLRAVAKQRYGVVPEHLTKAQASEFIGSLSAQASGNGHDHDDEVDEMGA
jgi:hypothetical protein